MFDPAVAKNFQKCGIAVLDSATEMFSMVLSSLGKDPNSQKPEDLNAAGEAMMKIRPFLRYIDTQRMITDLANGEICLPIGYSGDILQARDRAEENKTGQEIAVRDSEGRLDHLVRQLSDSERCAASEQCAHLHQLHAAAGSDRRGQQHRELCERQRRSASQFVDRVA